MKMWSVAYAIVILCLATIASAQVFGVGGCPNVQPQSDFVLQQYLGDWYEIYKFKANFENGQKCIHANYQLKDDGHVRVNNSGTHNGQIVQALGDLYMPDSTQPSSLKVRFAEGTPYGSYWVLDTDYKSYTLIYSCTSILGVSHFEFAWILGRQRTMDQAVIDKLFNEMKRFNIDVSHFMKADQTGC